MKNEVYTAEWRQGSPSFVLGVLIRAYQTKFLNISPVEPWSLTWYLKKGSETLWELLSG